MKTEFLGLRTAVYFVKDLKKARNWYVKVLGFKPYYDTPYYVGFEVGGYELGLHPAKPTRPSGGKGSKPGSENVAAYWGVKDVKKTYARLLKLGAKEHEKPTDVGGGVIIGAVMDPFKNVFRNNL